MLRLDRIVKPWKESGALNAHINLYECGHCRFSDAGNERH